MKTTKIDLIRDVLDKLLVDRHQLPLGRVDGIVLVVTSDKSQPRVAQLETGMLTRMRRLSPFVARRLQHLTHRLGFRWKRPVRLPWSAVQSLSRELQLDLSGENSRLLSNERWVCRHIIKRIPGNQIKKAAE